MHVNNSIDATYNSKKTNTSVEKRGNNVNSSNEKFKNYSRINYLSQGCLASSNEAAEKRK